MRYIAGQTIGIRAFSNYERPLIGEEGRSESSPSAPVLYKKYSANEEDTESLKLRLTQHAILRLQGLAFLNVDNHWPDDFYEMEALEIL
jgi:hypothetical protein